MILDLSREQLIRVLSMAASPAAFAVDGDGALEGPRTVLRAAREIWQAEHRSLLPPDA